MCMCIYIYRERKEEEENKKRKTREIYSERSMKRGNYNLDIFSFFFFFFKLWGFFFFFLEETINISLLKKKIVEFACYDRGINVIMSGLGSSLTVIYHPT